MAQLRQDFQAYLDRQTVILVTGPENAKSFAAFWRENDLPFVGLPDPKHSVLKLFGQEVKIFKLGRMPAQVIVDRAGVVRFVNYGDSMSDIPKNTELLALLEQINQDAVHPV